MPRVQCPQERFKAKEVENYQYTSALMEKRLKLFFRTIISAAAAHANWLMDSEIRTLVRSGQEETTWKN